MDDFLKIDKKDLSESTEMKWKTGYKYQLTQDIIVKTHIYPKEAIVTELVVLRRDGWMYINKFFSWDGCSGPTIDTDTNMRGGLVHDALYYLHRMELLPLSFRKLSDQELYRFMIKDGAYKWRARMYRWAVSKFGRSAAQKRKTHKVAFKR